MKTFNDYFVSGPTLANKITVDNQNKELFNGLIKLNRNSLFLCKIEERDITEVVNRFKNKTSTDVNFIDTYILKEIIHRIVKPLTYICNLSFQTGIFPQDMKLAKVRPIFKNGDRYSMDNYRPVALLPQFSKI